MTILQAMYFKQYTKNLVTFSTLSAIMYWIMANFTNLELQDKVLQEFNKHLVDDLKSLTQIRKSLSDKYKLAYSTIYKITTDSYKNKKAKIQPIRSKEIAKNNRVNKLSTTTFPKTLIFTGWEIRVGITQEFVDIIKQIAKYYSADVYLTPLWQDDKNFLPPSLGDFNIITSDLKINENLIFKYVQTHALSMSPLQGWSGAHETSVIFPGLIKELKTEKSYKLCRQIMTTGSVGKLNAFRTQYKHITDDEGSLSFNKRWSFVQNRRGGRTYEIAKQFTKPSALIVDILDKKTFLTRYITMENTGVVYDKGLKFTAFHNKPEISRPKALVMGDQHSFFADEQNFKAVSKMCDKFKPDSLILNDFIDFIAINRFDSDDFARIVKHPSLEDEIIEARTRLLKVSRWAKKIYYLGSNHDNSLTKFLAKEDGYKIGPNYKKAMELRLWQLQNPDRHPVEKALNLDAFKNLKFIPENKVLEIAGNAVIHGHVGISGRRVGFIPLAKIYNRLVMGHEHRPQVFRNSTMVGTSSKLELSYNIGPSDWLHAHCLVQPDGSTQLLPVLNGVWEK